MWIFYCPNDSCLMTHWVMTIGFLHIFIFNDVRADVKDEVKTVEVTEGATVTLGTDWTKGMSDDIMILWMFQMSGTRIAQLHKKNISNYYGEQFKNRLQLDTLTGSLTISNIGLTDSGLYKAQIISTDVFLNKELNVIVYATLPKPTIKQSSQKRSQSRSRSSSPLQCSVVCSVKSGNRVTLSWYNGSHQLSTTSDPDNSTLSVTLNTEHCDRNIYSCVAVNPVSNQTVQLSAVSYCSCTEEQRIYWWLIPVLLLLLLLIVAPIVAFLLYRRFAKKTPTNQVQTPEEEVHYAVTMFSAQRVQNMKHDGPDDTVYSSIIYTRGLGSNFTA